MSDDDFFSVPPASDAPIVLGAPPDSGYGEFSAPPSDYDIDFTAAPADYDAAAYVGDVNEAFGAPTEDVYGSVPPTEDDAADAMAMVPTATGPTPMQTWNEEWQATLLVRKEEENARRAELLEEARVALEVFQKERELKRESIMAKNREDEQAKLEAIEADLENDNSWQRVCKMVELQHESTDKSQDVKRMRDVMILLKNDVTKAAALSV
jgi:Clathrin light chain